MSDSFLPPRGACRLLFEEFGIKRAPATLAKLRVVGGSPPFRKVNRAVLYAASDLRTWASAALSIKHNSTSDRGSPDAA